MRAILPLVASLPTLHPEQEVIFVEGHSVDGTWEELLRVRDLFPQKRIRVMRQPGIGQGDAILAGFGAARGDVLLLYEGDGTSDPHDLFTAYDALASGRADFVLGNRFAYPVDGRAMPFVRQVANAVFAVLYSLALSQPLHDVLSGLKGLWRRDFEAIARRWGSVGPEDPFGDFELLHGAARLGLRIAEVPMRYYPRPHGRSKTRVVAHGWRLAQLALRSYAALRAS